MSKKIRHCTWWSYYTIWWWSLFLPNLCEKQKVVSNNHRIRFQFWRARHRKLRRKVKLCATREARAATRSVTLGRAQWMTLCTKTPGVADCSEADRGAMEAREAYRHHVLPREHLYFPTESTPNLCIATVSCPENKCVYQKVIISNSVEIHGRRERNKNQFGQFGREHCRWFVEHYEHRTLSDRWSGSTRFRILTKRPIQG